MKKIIEITDLNFHDYDETYYSSAYFKAKPVGYYLATFTGKIKDGNSDALLLWDGYSVSYVASFSTLSGYIKEIDDKPPEIPEQLLFKAIAAAAGHSTFK